MYLISVILEPLVTEEAVTDYLAESVNPTLLEGLAQLCKVKPVDPVVWLADWLLMNNPNKIKTDEITATTPT
jgi:nucleoside-diphosphate kinase